MKYRFVAAERASYPVRLLCKVVGVAASGFYAWLRRVPGRRQADEQRVKEKVGQIFQASRQTGACPRAGKPDPGAARASTPGCASAASGSPASCARVGLCPWSGAVGSHAPPTAGTITWWRPICSSRRSWLIGPIPSGWPISANIATAEGWLYLAAIKDMATREIPPVGLGRRRAGSGWSMADHLLAELACDALRMALRRRQPPAGLIHHSDRGVQYACTDYQAILQRHGLLCSMSRRGNGYDNAPMESFFGSLKNELVHRTSFATKEAARRALFEYIETL